MMDKFYSLPLKKPKSMRDGLCNFVQMIINEIEDDNPREALLKAVDLLNDLNGNWSPYQGVIDGLQAKPVAVLPRMGELIEVFREFNATTPALIKEMSLQDCFEFAWDVATSDPSEHSDLAEQFIGKARALPSVIEEAKSIGYGAWDSGEECRDE